MPQQVYYACQSATEMQGGTWYVPCAPLQPGSTWAAPQISV